jgi:UDPglucose--hexose-1-phosphate uridylyltransferase
MPELRKDAVVGRWVIISTERGRRPSDFDHALVNGRAVRCPFCEGHEADTPPEVYAWRAPDSEPNGPGWRVRVVSNKFPALRIEGSLDPARRGVFESMNGIGAHEVIIETPEHERAFAELEPTHAAEVFRAFRERIRDLEGDRRFRFCMVFKNVGPSAGASLVHPHSQLIALPIVPKRVMEELYGAERFHRMQGECVYCRIIDQERPEGARMITANDEFVALAPHAPRFPYETWILPSRHRSSFEELEDAALSSLAELTLDLLRRMNRVLGRPPYNYCLHTSPFSLRGTPYYHWHIELIPKLSHVAGFEWGTGFYINPVTPEEAARRLREEAPGRPDTSEGEDSRRLAPWE